MRFNISYPAPYVTRFPNEGADIQLFYDMLFAALRERGHVFRVFPTSGLPPEERGVVRFGYHSHGRQPLTWHIKRSYLRDTFYFDRDGYSGWSEMANSDHLFAEAMASDEADALNYAEFLREESCADRFSRCQQPLRRFDPGGRPFLFLPLQLPSDSVMSLSRFDYFAFARAVAEAVAETGRQLVIKRHPMADSYDVFHLMIELSKAPHVRLTNSAIGTLLQKADGVICINSSVGFEALAHGKPTFTAGRSDYDRLSIPIDDLAYLPGLLNEPPTPDVGRTAKFLSYFCRRYVVRNDAEAELHARLSLVEQQAEAMWESA